MNLLSQGNFLGRDRTTKARNSGNVLFSGFLIAFLGASGIQMSIPASFHTEESTPETKIVCQEHFGVKAIMADSALNTAEDTKNTEGLSKDCQQADAIENTLEAEVAIPDQAIITKEEQEEEHLYQQKVTNLEDLLKGHPLAKMAPSIAKQEPEIAALIVGIARKESQWGLHSPKKNGDCFNYWGFKGAGGRGTGMGYACFATREEAIEKIANRLEKLVDKRGTSKPSALVTPWKCGNSCATHSPESVQKWVSDVNQYYTKVLAMK